MCASLIERRGTTTVKSLCHALNSQFLIEDSDIKDALRVLKNPVGFQALRMWRGRSKTDATFVKVVRTPQYDDWARSLLESKPYLKPLTTIS